MPLAAAAPLANENALRPKPARDAPWVTQRLSAARKAWCGTGFVDDGRLQASSHFVPSTVPPGTSFRLTPFGAYPLVAGQPDTLAVFEVADRYHKRRKAGEIGLLSPRGSFVLRPDPKTALEPGGSVYVGIRLAANAIQPTAEQWAQVPATLRAGARAQGFRVPETGALPEGVVLVAAMDSEPTPGLPEGTVVDRLGPAADPCACEGLLECSLANKVTLDYAGYALCVPESWFWRHYEDDDWMSVNETMEDLWRGVNVHGSAVTSEVMDNLLGCWMIDTDNDSHGRTYSMFFSDGNAPRKFLHYALDLVRRFSDEIKDEWSGVTTCAGLRQYIEDVLDGEKGATKTSGVGPCTIEFRAVSSTTWLPDVKAVRKCGESHEDVKCGSFPKDMGQSFDDWGGVMHAPYVDHVRGVSYFQLMVSNEPWGPMLQPASEWLGWTTPEAGAVQVSANGLAFRGYQFDFSMFWARVALHYAYDRGDWGAWYGAWVYARTAMTYLVEYGRMLVHEMGHAHMGQGGHCVGNDGQLETACCFDIAAEHWKCRVSTLLGLPEIPSLRCTADPLFGNPSNPCGGEGAVFPLVCDRRTLCSTEEAIFWAAPCH